MGRAEAAPTYGFEITLTNPALASRAVRVEEVLEQVHAALRSERGVQIEKTHDGLVVTFPGGPRMVWTADGRVVEVKLGPATLADLERHKTRLQELIFDLGARPGLDLKPDTT